MLACRWDEAIEWQRAGRELYLRSGDVVGGAFCAINTVEILINQRRLHAAESLAADALRNLRAAEFAEGVASVEIQLARILIERGVWTQAESMLERVIDEFNRLGKPFYVLDATVVRAHGWLSAGDPLAALTLLRDAQTAAGEQPQLRPKAAWVAARALAALGRTDEALAEIVSGIEAARAVKALYEEGLLLTVQTELTADPDAARRSIQILKALGVETTPSGLTFA
jgi:tetratricopeptide (TPR) repeat protein